jgi:hypothetical protein
MTSDGFPFPRTLARAMIALASLTMIVAFVAICIRTGTAWPWMRVVHEDGMRTMLGTVFYFEHAARELPLDVLLGIAIGACVFYAFTPADMTLPPRVPHRMPILAAASILAVAGIIAGAVVAVGPQSTLENLLQNHTRPGADLLWGSHWRYHLLERLAMMLVAIGLAGFLRYVTDGGVRDDGNTGLKVALATIGAYLALTAVFAHSLPSMAQSFRDPQYLGHQARELMTHGLVTVPIGWGICMLLLTPAQSRMSSSSLALPRRAAGAVIAALLLGLLGLLIGGFVGLAAMRSNAVDHGQTKDLVMLIFPHFFEHTLTYLVVPPIAALTYELLCLPRTVRTSDRRAR